VGVSNGDFKRCLAFRELFCNDIFILFFKIIFILTHQNDLKILKKLIFKKYF